MARPVLIGAGLGLLLLAAVAGVSLWFAQPERQPAASVTSPAILQPRMAPQPQLSAPSPASPRVGSAASTREERREHHQRLAELREQFNAVRAQGAAASPEKMRAVIDELEALSPEGLDKRYFQTLRELLDISAQVQKHSQELQALSSSKAPEDVARREAILKEIQALSKRAVAQAQSLQAYVPAAPPTAKTP